jgi:hypothetical protein
MLLIVLGEILISYLAYRRAKANGTLPEPEPRDNLKEPYVTRELGPDATRFERITNWLGLEKTSE